MVRAKFHGYLPPIDTQSKDVVDTTMTFIIMAAFEAVYRWLVKTTKGTTLVEDLAKPRNIVSHRLGTGVGRCKKLQDGKDDL